MHAVEIIGTIMTAFFTVISFIFIKLFWFDAIVPFWVALVGTIALGGTAIWACWKVGRYWYYKLKERLGKKK
jgi:membrane protein implicated in regulation of membrane protease activity